MAVTASKLDAKSFAKPDETRPFVANGHLDVLTFGGITAGAPPGSRKGDDLPEGESITRETAS